MRGRVGRPFGVGVGLSGVPCAVSVVFGTAGGAFPSVFAVYPCGRCVFGVAFGAFIRRFLARFRFGRGNIRRAFLRAFLGLFWGRFVFSPFVGRAVPLPPLFFRN